MQKIKTGIVGCGKVAHLHAAALANLAESEFTAVYSRSQSKADEFGGQYSVKGYSDLEAFMRDSGVQAILLCTPHPFHVDPTVMAAKYGVHVLIEKPLASSLEHCDTMIKTMKDANLKLGMISQRRWYAPVRRVKDAIESGKIGTPVLGTVTLLGWRDKEYYDSDPWRGSWKDEGGGVLVNQSPHQLDILQWYMGDIDEVFGFWANLNHEYIEVEDTAVALIRFKNGALGNIVVSNSQNPALYGNVHVHGSNGASIGVKTDGGAMFIAGRSKVEEPPINDVWTVSGEVEMLDQWVEEDSKKFSEVDATKYYHELQIQDFLHAIAEDREPVVTGEEGRKTVELFTAIYRSNRDGKSVKFPVMPEVGKDDYDGRLG